MRDSSVRVGCLFGVGASFSCFSKLARVVREARLEASGFWGICVLRFFFFRL